MVMVYPKFKVCCRCFTYNQAAFIRDTMNGFCMQQTNFPFVCCIVDDASTDNEQSVIESYLKDNFDFSKDSVSFKTETDYAYITFAQHNINRNCYFAVVLLKYNHYQINKPKLQYLKEWSDGVEYFSFCEGDDYWIMPEKLQKQADFLDANLDFSLVCGICKSLIQSTGEVIDSYYTGEKEFTFVSMLFEDHVASETVMYRSELLSLYHNEISPRWKMGDYPLWLFLSKQGRVYRFADIMSVYRVNEESASHSKDINKSIEFKLSSIDCSLFFMEKYNVNDDVKQRFITSSILNLRHRGLSTQSFEFIQAAISFGFKFHRPLSVKDAILCLTLQNKVFCASLKLMITTYNFIRKNISKNYRRK